jgi:hypothetical protein
MFARAITAEVTAEESAMP